MLVVSLSICSAYVRACSAYAQACSCRMLISVHMLIIGMSSEQKKEEPKMYTCQECGKRYFNIAQLAGHLSSHSRKEDKAEKEDNAKGYVTFDDLQTFAASIENALRQATPTPTPTPPTTPPVGSKIGQFVVKRKPHLATEDIICPNCGMVEIDHPLDVIEKEKPVEKEVEVVPPGYIRGPEGGEDWLRILGYKHADGKGPEDCPECAKTLLQWFNQNRQKLERASRVAR